jgi:KipI family sensor histidine kinase inhibitor
MSPRIREAGDAALLVEWAEVIDPAVNARAIAVAAAIQGMRLPGLRDVVPTYRSVAVYFDPLRADPDALRAALVDLNHVPSEAVQGRTVDVPITYGGEGGPDLAAVAEWAGMSPNAVAERHVSREYRVFMLGFLPGFAYLGPVDDEIAAPRRETPRTRVPAGSVGIAGRQTGIYPRESPGGWQIIGRSPLRAFDPDRVPSALFKAGDHVRFVSMPAGDASEVYGSARTDRRWAGDSSINDTGRTVTVVRPGLFTTVQDQGRWGHQSSGVSVSGALDLVSHRLANLLVGNAADAATLEVTLAGPELRIDREARVAVTGADLRATLDGAAIPPGVSRQCQAGSVLRFGERAWGARAYVAFDGGIDTPVVLGSRATHVGAALGGFGGRALAAGDRVRIGPVTGVGPLHAIAHVKGSDPSASQRSVRISGGARLRVLPGPQDDFFAESAFAVLEGTRFVVTPQSNRMGYRLSGAAIPRVSDREMLSDAAFVGGIQVPASGEPVLLMSDRQTTGGYPQLATVITADLPLAGQLAPGDWVEFTRCTRAEAIAAVRDQEAMFGGLT